VIVLVVGEMDRASAELDAVVQRRLMHVVPVETLSAERRDQAGVDVHHTVLEIGRNQHVLQKTAHDDQLHARLAAGLEHRVTVGFGRGKVLGPQHQRRDRGFGGVPQTARGRIAGNHQANCHRQLSGSDSIQDVPQRGSTAGDQDGDGKGRIL
jgi:hypothetical protein